MKSEIYNECCMVGMSRYPDKFFDLAIVDPPYGIGMDGNNNWSGSKHEKKDWDNEAPPVEYFHELKRVSKNQIVWGANHFISRMPYDSSAWIYWDKKNDGFSFADGELAWTSFDKAIRCIRIHRSQIFKEYSHIHPTQKSVMLYEWILQNYAKPNDKILDTHMGSQSSRIAAYLMGFDYWGWEIDKEYFDKGDKRFKEITSQQQLFRA